MDNVRSTLKMLMNERGDTYAQLSKLLGRNPAYIQQFVTRGSPRKLDEGDRRVLARYFGVSEACLGGAGDDEHAQFRSEAKSRTALSVENIPRLALGASAGAGAVAYGEQPAGAIAFDRRWLRQVGVSSDGASILQVEGESMAPTLQHGDDIMIDRRDGASRIRDGVYVMRLDDVLVVKRIALGPRRGQIGVLSDNPHYPRWPDIDRSLIEIVGRVVWIGRRLT